MCLCKTKKVELLYYEALCYYKCQAATKETAV